MSSAGGLPVLTGSGIRGGVEGGHTLFIVTRVIEVGRAGDAVEAVSAGTSIQVCISGAPRGITSPGGW